MAGIVYSGEAARSAEDKRTIRALTNTLKAVREQSGRHWRKGLASMVDKAIEDGENMS